MIILPQTIIFFELSYNDFVLKIVKAIRRRFMKKKILLICMILAIPLSAFSMPCDNDCERHGGGHHHERMRHERHHCRHCGCLSIQSPYCSTCARYYTNYYYNSYTPFGLSIRTKGFGLRLGL